MRIIWALKRNEITALCGTFHFISKSVCDAAKRFRESSSVKYTACQMRIAAYDLLPSFHRLSVQTARARLTLYLAFALSLVSCMRPQLLQAQTPSNAATSLRIYSIDVEGGQSTLLVAPSGASLLVDTGWPGNNGRDAGRVQAAMRDAGITGSITSS